MLRKLNITQSKDPLTVLNSYPEHISARLHELRELILDTAEETEGINEIEETLKWGEVSYLVAWGSTIRIDWKSKTPDRFSIYFKCTTKLVATFKKLYGDLFKYENNRAIYFELDEEIPKKELTHCVSLALRYHKVKDKISY